MPITCLADIKHSFYINLEHRTDRKDSFLYDLPKGIFNVNFFKAVKHSKGAHGCGLSHMYLIKYAKDNNLPYMIVAEDDAFYSLETHQTIALKVDIWMDIPSPSEKICI